MRAIGLMWLPLVICVGVSMFLLKYKVQALEDELVAKQTQVLRDRATIRVLHAEWAYLNDPERLRQLSTEYLGFGPPAVINIAEIETLPLRGAAMSPGDQPPERVPARGPLDHIEPQYQTELQAPQAPATRSPSVVSVSIARLQRLLFPTAAGATPRVEAQP
jgi:hypothetical protein